MPYYRNNHRGYGAMGTLTGAVIGYFFRLFLFVSGYISILLPGFWLASKIDNYRSSFFWIFGISLSYILCCLVFYVKGKVIQKSGLHQENVLFWKVLLFSLILWAPVVYLMISPLFLKGFNFDSIITFALALIIGFISIISSLSVFEPNRDNCLLLSKWAYTLGLGNYGDSQKM